MNFISLLSGILLAYSCLKPDFTLEDLVLSNSDLPKGCILKEIDKNSNLPCYATSNPFISSSPDFINCFVGAYISDTALIPKVKRVLFSIYTDQAEIGIFAIETLNKGDATLFFDHMNKQNDQAYKSKLLYSESIFIWVWRDKGKIENFDAIIDLLMAKCVHCQSN